MTRASPKNGPRTPELEQWAVDAAATGMSAQAIAGEIGVTRNAVCGKLHRAMVRAGHIVKRQKPRKWMPKTTFAPQARQPSMPVPVKLPPLRPSPMPVPIVYTGDAVYIRDLADDGCRFAVSPHNVGPREHLFCNQEQRENSKYCPPHHELCLVAVSYRKVRE